MPVFVTGLLDFIIQFLLGKKFNLDLTKIEIEPVILTFLLFNVSIWRLSIFNAFLPNSKTKPKVNAKKNTSIIIKPYIPFVYALIAKGNTKSISKSNNKNNNPYIKKEILNCVLF